MPQQNKREQEEQQHLMQQERDEANKRRFIDQSGQAAQDLPGAEHGQNVVDPPEEITRNLPQQHGGELGGDGGLRGSRDLGDAKRHGGRGRN